MVQKCKNSSHRKQLNREKEKGERERERERERTQDIRTHRSVCEAVYFLRRRRGKRKRDARWRQYIKLLTTRIRETKYYTDSKGSTISVGKRPPYITEVEHLHTTYHFHVSLPASLVELCLSLVKWPVPVESVSDLHSVQI